MTTDLPPGWAWAKLGDLGAEIRGQLTPEHGTSYDLYSVPAFSAGRPERINGAQVRSGKRGVQPGDVLLCKINPRINRVWVVAKTEGFPQIASTEYLVLRPHEPRMSSFLQMYLSSPRFRDWIKLSVEGATGSHTRAKSGPILQQPISIAPLTEQERIVAAIEEHFSRLDAVEVSLAATQSRVRGLRVVLARSATRDWPTTELGDLADVFVGSTPSRKKPDLWDGPVPWVSSGEIQFCRINETRESIATAAVRPDRIHPPGTVLLGMIGEGRTRGQAAVLGIAAAHNQNSAAIRTRPSQLDPRWLFYVFSAQYESNRRVGSGNNQPALNKARVRSLRIPLPPLDEQHRLVEQLDEVAAALDQLGTGLEGALQRCAALRSSVLAEAFSGRLAPQDPADEPAPVLLERIAASRRTTPTQR